MGMIDIADVQDAAGPGADWTKNDADTQWQKTITPTADDTTEETEGTAKFLQVTKVVDSEGCDKTTVDGVEVCVAKGHQFTFTCKYPLADQTISTAQDFTVSGSDTTDSATATGTLHYALAVDAGNTFAIGNTVTATITPESSGLVTATILRCEVTNSDLTSDNQVAVIKTQAGSCSTECAAGWTLFTSNGKSSCLKSFGKKGLSQGAATCAAAGARLPLPVNAQNNAGAEDWTVMYGSGKWNDSSASSSAFIVCQQFICSQEPTCDLGVTITTGQGDSTLGFAFNSFKWSTSKVGGNDVSENQDLTCAISLAKLPPKVNSIGCA